MHYTDPSRPQVAYRAAYVGPDGKAIAPLPQPCVRPLEDGHFMVSAWLIMTHDYQCREYFHWCEDAKALAALMVAFAEDPEETLRKEFAYQGLQAKPPMVAHEPGPKKEFKLSDIGL